MNKKQLIFVRVMTGLILSLSLCGCADNNESSVRYTNPESIEYQDYSANQQREIVDSISQAYNKETGLRDKLISNQLQTRDSDIELMNERYSYGQNTTSKGFPRR
jgi:hypothetical protein